MEGIIHSCLLCFKDIEFAGGSFQIVVGEFAPPRFRLTPDLFPLAFQYIVVHGFSFGPFEKLPRFFGFMKSECLQPRHAVAQPHAQASLLY